MRLKRLEKVFKNKIAKIWVDENTKNHVGHIQFENIHKVYVFQKQDDLLMFYIYSGTGKTQQLLSENLDKFILEDDYFEGIMQITMQMN